MNRLTTCTIGALLVVASTTHAQNVNRYDARTFFETTTIFGASFSHDEQTLLITSDETGVFNAFAQPAAGGERTQLTFSETDAIFAIGWFPEDSRFLYRADQGGNELAHIYVQYPNGQNVDLTPGDTHIAQFAGFGGDFSCFYIQTNERTNRSMDLYRYDINSFQRELVFANDGGFSVDSISRDGQWLGLSRVRNNADNDLFVYNLGAGNAEPMHITEHEGNITHGIAGFSRDGATLRYTSDKDSEFARLWSFDMTNQTHKLVDEAAWDIMYTYESWNSRYRVRGVNADARTVITITDTRNNQVVELPDVPRGDIGGVNISRSESQMAFYVNGDTAPSNLYILNLESGKHKRLTNTLNKAIDETYLVASEVIRYKSFDGLDIPALLYKPHGASAANPAPAVLFIHGGPGGQSRTGYSATIQHLVNHGYAILSVNNRGSSGYGKTFFHLDDKRHGEDDLQDCVYARKWLETLDWIDDDRIGIMGGSYGGYMVAAALAFTPDVFDVGVDIFGVTNWLRTLESIPPWWADFREALYAELGDPAEDAERLRRISPLFHASNIKRPLLVVQGANDPRVLQVESDELVAAVRENGVPVEYVLFDDEGHGFSKRENRITASESYLDFLDRYLRHKADQ